MQRAELGADTLQLSLSKLLDGKEAIVRHVMPMRIRRRGVETRLVLDDGLREPRASRVDPALVKAIVRGRRGFEDLVTGRAQSLIEIAEAEGVTAPYVGHLIPLAFLSPDIVASILSGTQPADLTTEMLTKRIDLPID